MNMTTRLDDRCNALLVAAAVAAVLLTGWLTAQFHAEVAAETAAASETLADAGQIVTLPTVMIVAQR